MNLDGYMSLRHVISPLRIVRGKDGTWQRHYRVSGSEFLHETVCYSLEDCECTNDD